MSLACVSLRGCLSGICCFIWFLCW